MRVIPTIQYLFSSLANFKYLMAVQDSHDLTIAAAASIVPNIETELNYSKRAQWLRAALLGANDGLVSTASLMMGVGAVKDDAKAMVLSGFAGLVAGSCSMALGEYVSVYSQLDMEVAQMKRARQDSERGMEEVARELPSPMKAAMASALSFIVGAMVPLLAAGFIGNYKVRLGVVVAAASMALLAFGCTGAVLGRAPVWRSGVRVLVGGWLALAITFGLMRLLGSTVI